MELKKCPIARPNHKKKPSGQRRMLVFSVPDHFLLWIGVKTDLTIVLRYSADFARALFLDGQIMMSSSQSNVNDVNIVKKFNKTWH